MYFFLGEKTEALVVFFKYEGFSSIKWIPFYHLPFNTFRENMMQTGHLTINAGVFTLRACFRWLLSEVVAVCFYTNIADIGE